MSGFDDLGPGTPLTLEDLRNAIAEMSPGGPVERREYAYHSAFGALEFTKVDGELRVSCGEFSELVSAPLTPARVDLAIARTTGAYVTKALSA